MKIRLMASAADSYFSMSKVHQRSINLYRCIISVSKFANRLFNPQPYLFGYLDPQTCLDVSSRSINLEITHLDSQTYSIVLFRALNLILSII